MFQSKLFLGFVENTDDIDQQFKLQIRLIPEMKDVPKNDLPWLRPMFMETDSASSFNPIPVGSMVWCLFIDEFYKTGFYIKSAVLDDLVDYDSIKNDLSKIAEISSQDYPKVTFTKYSDGTTIFHNVSTGESGTYHKSGTYTVIDKDGSVTVKSVKNIKLYNEKTSIELKDDGTIEQSTLASNFKITDSGFEFDGNANHLVTFEHLKAILSAVFTTLDSRMMIDPLTGSTGTPMPSPTSLIALTLVPEAGGIPVPAAMETMKASKVKTS